MIKFPWFRKKQVAMNAVAGIVSAHGNFRVVCGPLNQMWCHVDSGEKLYVVPELWLSEGGPFPHVANLIATVRAYINENRPPDIVRF